jgi:hypothetical protein
MIISDVSSDEDDSLYGNKFDKRRINYHNFTTQDPEKKLFSDMYRKVFHNRKLKHNNYLQRNGHMMSNSPKKNAVKPSLNKINKSNSHSHRITSNHCVKFSLDKFRKSNSESHMISSITEVNFVQTSQINTKQQIRSVKNNIFSERRTHTEAPHNANQKRVSNIKDKESLPKMAYVRKLEIQNQRRKEIEYLRNIQEDDLPTPDLNSLCTYTEDDAQVHPLLSTNLSLVGEEKQSRNRKAIRPLLSNEEHVLIFNPIEEKSNSENNCTKSPPCIGSTMSTPSPEKRKTSTPLSLQFSGMSFSLSPLEYSENMDRISSAPANQFETHVENSCNLPSPFTEDIRNHKYHLTMKTLRQKQKNSTDMGYVL